jgi:hypothetical protein
MDRPTYDPAFWLAQTMSIESRTAAVVIVLLGPGPYLIGPRVAKWYPHNVCFTSQLYIVWTLTIKA